MNDAIIGAFGNVLIAAGAVVLVVAGALQPIVSLQLWHPRQSSGTRPLR